MRRWAHRGTRPAPTLRMRVAAMFVASALAGCAAATVVALDMQKLSTTDNQLRGTWQPARHAATALLVDLVDQQTGERGFVITGDPRYLRPYATSDRSAQQAVAEIKRLLAGHRAIMGRLDAVVSQWRLWRADVAAPELAARRAGNQTLVDRLVNTNLGINAFIRLRVNVSLLQNAIDGATQQQEQRSASALDNLQWALVGAGAAVAALGVALMLLLGRWVLRPLRHLRANLRRVASGALAEPVREIGPRELSDVAADADAMRRALLDEVDRVRVATEALAQRGPVVVGLSQQLAPPDVGPLPGLRIATALQAAEGLLAGDWADVIPLTEHRVALTVGDVSGHGADAGLEAVRLKHVVRTALELTGDPGRALALAAEGMRDAEERFATLAIVRLDLTNGDLSWANAGHLSPRIVPAGRLRDEQPLRRLEPTGPMLSWVGGQWPTRTERIQPGEVLLLFTDGLVEARDPGGRQFGMDGLVTALRSVTVREVDSTVSALSAAVRAHAAGAHSDDITLVAASWEAATGGSLVTDLHGEPERLAETPEGTGS